MLLLMRHAGCLVTALIIDCVPCSNAHQAAGTITYQSRVGRDTYVLHFLVCRIGYFVTALIVNCTPCLPMHDAPECKSSDKLGLHQQKIMLDALSVAPCSVVHARLQEARLPSPSEQSI